MAFDLPSSCVVTGLRPLDSLEELSYQTCVFVYVCLCVCMFVPLCLFVFVSVFVFVCVRSFMYMFVCSLEGLSGGRKGCWFYRWIPVFFPVPSQKGQFRLWQPHTLTTGQVLNGGCIILPYIKAPEKATNSCLISRFFYIGAFGGGELRLAKSAKNYTTLDYYCSTIDTIYYY